MKNGSILKKLIFLFGFPIILTMLLIMSVSAQAQDPTVVLTGVGTPTIDGTLSPGEWDSAGSIYFPVNTPGGGETPGTLFIMNDEENLYIAIWFSYTDWRNSASITFDNHNDGALQPGDDSILINPDFGFCDEACTTEPPCPDNGFCWFYDTDLGGTNDGAGAFSNDGGFTVYEFSHPLDSPDDDYDFSLIPGDTVGFNVHIVLIAIAGEWPNNTGDTFFPAPSSSPWLYGDIVIQGLERFSDLGDGTVRDNSTGLIWLKDANCFGQMDWYDAMDAAASLANDQCGLTDGSVAGDWHLPTKEEWEAFVDTAYSDPALCNAAGTGKWSEGDAFNNVVSTPPPYYYWSSTTYEGFYRYLMPMLVGETGWADWTLSAGVWPVRGGTTHFPWPTFHHDNMRTGNTPSPGPTTNHVLWTYQTGDEVWSSPAVADGKVYIRSIDERLYCLNADTGAPIWDYETGGPVMSASATVADGKVYIGSADGKVYCLNADTGAPIWDYLTGGSVFESSPAVADGKVYVGSDDYKVYCLDANTGAHLWDYPTGGPIFTSSPAVADGKVYIGSAAADGRVYCLNADTGAHLWDYPTGGPVMSSSLAVADGKVYVGANDLKVHCLDADTGALIWDYPTGGAVISTPAVADGKVYVGSNDGKVYCLNADTGAHIWDCLMGSFGSSPAVADGKVYIGSGDGKVYCLNADTGAHIWDYLTGDYQMGVAVISSPAVADSKVYIGSCNGKVYAFGGVPTNTPVGDNVTVTDPTTGFTMTFDEITLCGTTSIATSDTGPEPQAGFEVAGEYYYITTTATYIGSILIEIPYDENQVVGNEEDLKIMKWNSVTQQFDIDITIGVDTTNNIIYGITTSLSIFAVMRPVTPGEQIAEILEFFDESVEEGTLEGRGRNPRLAKVRLRLMRKLLVFAGNLLERERTKAACFALKRAYKRCDALRRPPDFVTGTAAPQLADMIKDLGASLECKWAQE